MRAASDAEIIAEFEEFFARIATNCICFVLMTNEFAKRDDGADIPDAELKKYNACLREAARRHQRRNNNVELVEITTLIKSDDERKGWSHFDRIVYQRIADQIIKRLTELNAEKAGAKVELIIEVQ